MKLENPVLLARQLKGAPLSLLWVMMFDPQPHDESWLSGMTGYTIRSIEPALKYLKEANYITRTQRYGGWIILDGIFQPPLICDMKNFPLDPVINTIIINGREKDIVLEKPINNNTSGKNCHSLPEIELSIYQQNCHNLLKFYHVEDPKAIQLAQIEGLTICEIIGNHDYLFRMGKDDRDVGLMIHRLENRCQVQPTDWEHEALYPDAKDRAEEKINKIEIMAKVELINWSEVF